MQTVSYDIGLFTKDNPSFFKALKDFTLFHLQTNTADLYKVKIPIFICDELIFQHPEVAIKLAQHAQKNLIKKIILLTSTQVSIPIEVFNLLQPFMLKRSEQFTTNDILEVYERIRIEEQDLTYLALSKELNEEYESVKKELELQITEKTNNLIESRRKIYEINSRTEFLRKTLFTVSEIHYPSLVEEKLNQLLTQAQKVTWVQVVPDFQQHGFEKDIKTSLESTYYKTDLVVNKDKLSIYYFKGDKKPFKKSDQDLFNKLSDMLQISLNRFAHLAELQKSESLYQLAFQSSKNPILILNSDYQILQSNLPKSTGKFCYQVLFKRQQPCFGCQLGKKFQIQNNESVFQVDSNILPQEDIDSLSQYVHVYEDITERNRLEKKIMQSSRLAELGLISSSIAHELNNPLSGMISYLQLMRLDLPKEHEFQKDIALMYDATQRMKKIIDDLLIFSRKNDVGPIENVDLNKVLLELIDSFQMQIKLENLTFVFQPAASIKPIMVSRSVLKESLHLLVQYFIQKQKNTRKQKPNHLGLVEVKIFQDQMNTSLSFNINLGQLEPTIKTKELTILILEKLLSEQSFQLVIDHPEKDWSRFTILIPSQFH